MLKIAFSTVALAATLTACGTLESATESAASPVSVIAAHFQAPRQTSMSVEYGKVIVELSVQNQSPQKTVGATVACLAGNQAGKKFVIETATFDHPLEGNAEHWTAVMIGVGGPALDLINGCQKYEAEGFVVMNGTRSVSANKVTVAR